MHMASRPHHETQRKGKPMSNEQIKKNAAITALIKARFYVNGGDIVDAIDHVCGKGTVEKLAGDLWEAFNADKAK
jgi:hypothetical protein